MECGILVSLRRGDIDIYHSTVLALRNPKYIRLLLNPKEKRMCVQGMSKKAAETFPVPKQREDADWEFRISSKQMSAIIYEINSWNTGSSYRIPGVLRQEYRLVEFDFHAAEEISGGEGA